jgi:hypothetical protein
VVHHRPAAQRSRTPGALPDGDEIKVGAVSPLAGIFAALKLLLACWLVPGANPDGRLGGILPTSP